jgi:tetratricopeptide (TPR) repeat protein
MVAMFGRTPDPGSLGYQAALEAGLAIAETGASAIALPYFERAAELRETGVVLTQIGKCKRDLGRLDEAEEAYRCARDAPGGSDRHALLGLIAVLCDQRNYESALPLAKQAAIDYPDCPPALTVAARCIEEFAAVLAGSGRASREHIERVKLEAQSLRDRARELEPEAEADLRRRRRERTFPIHSLSATPERWPHNLGSGDRDAHADVTDSGDEDRFDGQERMKALPERRVSRLRRLVELITRRR